MAKKKRKNRSTKGVGDFFKLLLVLAALGLLLWFWREKGAPKLERPAAKKAAVSPSKTGATAPESKSVESPPTSEPVTAAKITGLFPKQAWLDNYLQVPASLGGPEKKTLVAVGLAPPGKNPDQIRNPEKLLPSLLVVEKEGGQFLKKDQFDFVTPEPTEAGIQGTDLTGIPRITSGDLVDLNGDGRPEIAVRFDTHGAWTEAIGLLQWEGSRLRWVKTRDASGIEKIALWLAGSTSMEAQEVDLTNRKLTVRNGRLDPKQPEKGFVYKTTVWKWKDGFLQKE
jgi:hypothetical protein